MRDLVYLDSNATAPLRPEARAAMLAALDVVGNPSSTHAAGRTARVIREDARDAVAALVNARPDQVVFTSGGTEANALALTGLPRATLLCSAVEHDAILAHVPATDRVAVDENGVVDLDALTERLNDTIARRQANDHVLVSIMAANNETGVLQPIPAVVAAARAAGALVHCDAAQAPGRMPLSFRDLAVDFLTISAHKMGGPPGVGALIARDPRALSPLLPGGGQERGVRSGTENLPGLAGFAAAAAAVQDKGAAEAAEQARRRDRLESTIKTLSPETIIHGAGAPRLPNTSCLGLPGLAAETQVMLFDLAGVAVSAGSACSSGKVGPSHVLMAMGAAGNGAREAIRVSLGWGSTDADVDRFLAAYPAVRDRARARAA